MIPKTGDNRFLARLFLMPEIRIQTAKLTHRFTSAVFELPTVNLMRIFDAMKSSPYWHTFLPSTYSREVGEFAANLLNSSAGGLV